MPTLTARSRISFIFGVVCFQSWLLLAVAAPWCVGELLASTDTRNDGQVLIGDALIPGSTLLGYVNADHWDVAIAVERQMPYRVPAKTILWSTGLTKSE